MTSNKTARPKTDEHPRIEPVIRLLTALLVSAVATGLASAVSSLPIIATGLDDAVDERLALSGVSLRCWRAGRCI